MATVVYVVKVREERDVELGMPGYSQRFEFTGEDAAKDAWVCWAAAMRHGFEAEAVQVSRRGDKVMWRDSVPH